MNELFTNATKILDEEIGQDKLMALATRNGDGVAVRTVNVYTYDGCFYFVTEADSNKFKQITHNNQVALSVDAIQVTGQATLLEHPCDESNKELVHYIEEKLPNQFARYSDSPIMRVIKISPANATFILLETGQGFLIDFSERTAIGISHEM
jgi:Pyridoxamine-phosphate oxidase